MLSNPVDIIIDSTRIIVYLAIVYQSITLANLYQMAWKHMKKTPIIFALGMVFYSLAIYFTFMAFACIVGILMTNRAYREIMDTSIVLLVFIMISLYRFQEKSLDNEIKKLEKK